MQVIAIVLLKKHLDYISIFIVVISKLGYWQEFYSVVLLKINKDLKIRFNCAFLLFCLTICLKLESSEKFLLNIKKIVQGKPKF